MQIPVFPDLSGLNRRSFLIGSTSLAAAALWSACATRRIVQLPKFPDYPFQLGVASGDPTSDGVVLWTRLAPKPLEGGGMIPDPVQVSWQVAEDESMSRVVRAGRTVAAPEWAHSVHVEVDGLRPERWYWYQFKAGNELSPKGRTRTLPSPGSIPQRIRFAFASCQHYETGYFTAYEHMSREDLELVFHLGDYIYENAGRDDQIRKHAGPELNSLDQYRTRYAQYRTDPHLQLMHRVAPWVVTWDDHEFDNNCAGAISEEPNVLTSAFLERRARAYQAYYEHMPLRRTAQPRGPDMRLYRRIAFGQLAEFFVLDTRQYRTDQPCGDGNQTPCESVFDPNATVLGERQRRWLLGGLSRSSALWNVLAQQIMMARVDRTVGDPVAYSMDQWPGYESERRQLLEFFKHRKIANPVVLAGDIHSNWANELTSNIYDPVAQPVATEFVGTSISSGGDGTRTPKDLDRLLAENPFVKFHNAERGYVRCEVTPRQWRTDYRVVEFVTRPDAPMTNRQSFVVESGQPRLHSA